MKKLLVVTFLGSFLLAKMIDGIAILVNNEPITLYEIESTAQKLGLTPRQAIDILIRKKLEDAQIKELGIEVSDFEVEDALDNFARKQGMDIFSLRQAIESKGINWEEYKKRFKEQLLRKKLYQKISQMHAKNISESKLKEYYDTHKEEFSIAKKALVRKYISPSKEILERIRQNPLYEPQNPILLSKGEELIELDKVNPQFAAMINSLKEGEFSQILPVGDKFLLLYIKQKEGKEYIPFEEARNFILNRLANQKGTKSVKEYFDRLKASANIKILRLPQ
ncbi:hypothetical protein NitYY0826_C1860 [Nitratiruptor sp. YY08-26]|uniref:SurA N-terminal domain-containing protein n=1 Tax=unclassified Nitratiruptor TaxID=2624044 RepID=UPI0019169915|nr:MULTISPECIES: peptidyl-prolyl cis-trans isomerase [unclassified Nitratiruptor]BCD62972.1 hypothetical protein NitYY0813_C1858 [Nitratiruptor sp. YY08-13]BCD66907.1 hypothetical protein NitYY0826_C1860 [Nitratiruptor sp. YY08-26]